MKKIYTFLACAISMVALSSCEVERKESTTVVPPDEKESTTIQTTPDRTKTNTNTSR